jgi:hypothetical protein
VFCVSAFRKESLVWYVWAKEGGVCWPLLLKKGGRRGKKWKLLAAGDDWRKQGAGRRRSAKGAGAICETVNVNVNVKMEMEKAR